MSLVPSERVARQFEFRAVGADNRVETGVIDAIDEIGAVKTIRARDLTVLKITESKQARADRSKAPIARGNRTARLLRPRFGEWARLLQAGLTIPDAIRVDLGTKASGATKILLGRLLADLRAGAPLHAALKANAPDLDAMTLALIGAGERSGSMESCLLTLADHYAATARFRTSLRSALAYPLTVLATAFIVVFFLLYLVVPNIKQLANEHGSNMRSGQFVFHLSDFVSEHLLSIGLALAGAAIGLALIARRRGGARLALSAARVIPPARRFASGLELARYVRALGTLISAGILLSDAVRIANQGWSSGEGRVAGANVLTRINEGLPLSRAMVHLPAMPEDLIELVQLGEGNGRIGRVLLEIADQFEARAQQALNLASKLIGPALIIAMGLMVGFVVVSIMDVFLSLSEATLR